MTKESRNTILVILLTLGIVSGLFYYPSINNSNQNVPNDNLSVPCLIPNMRLVQHTHAKLDIVLDGKPVDIPGGIGISGTCHRALHTHDDEGGPGVIHNEAQDSRQYTLGDFFDVWGKVLSPVQIFDKQVDASHAISMTVNGEPNNEFGNLILQDQQTIKIEYVAVSTTLTSASGTSTSTISSTSSKIIKK